MWSLEASFELQRKAIMHFDCPRGSNNNCSTNSSTAEASQCGTHSHYSPKRQKRADRKGLSGWKLKFLQREIEKRTPSEDQK